MYLTLKEQFPANANFRTIKNCHTLGLGPILTINHNFYLSKLIAAYLLM